MKLTSCTSRGELASSGGLHQALSAVSQPSRSALTPASLAAAAQQHELHPQTMKGQVHGTAGAAVVRAVGRGEDEATTP